MAFWGPLLGAVAGSVLTGIFNRDSQESANQSNVALWREQAAYNDPSNQMRRLEAAGLSPHLAYGQIAESKMSNPPTMQPVHYEAPRMGLVEYSQVQNMQEQNKLLRSQNEAAAAEAKYKRYETDYLINNDMLRGDTGIVRAAGRIPDIVGDRVNKFVRWMENENEKHYREQQERNKREKENR